LCQDHFGINVFPVCDSRNIDERKPEMEISKSILVEIPLEFQFARQVIRGIYRCAWPNCQWVIYASWSRYKTKVMRGKIDGMISMRRPSDYMPVARRYGFAAVGVGRWSPERQFHGLPYVDIDPTAMGEMAAEYFIERGFRNFGTFSTPGAVHSLYRCEAFAAAVRRKKLTCDVFDQKKKYPPSGEPLPTVLGVSERMRRWLAGLPKPLAVFVVDDVNGTWVCAVCQRSGIRVPEEVAILGANNDDIYCDISHPPLSSIRVPAEQVGYEAARLLDAMLRGGRVPKRPILLPPIDVVTRQSTDVMAVDDARFVKAVRFIREHAHEGIRVKHVIAAAALPKRMLERRFKKVLGRGPFAEIRRIQVERIMMLLAQTDKTLEAIASECGFKNISHMSVAFKKITGMTPGAYRKQFRSR
jgi:LacI family transcriptional regulator